MSDLSDRLHALLRCQAPEPRRPLETAEMVARRLTRQAPPESPVGVPSYRVLRDFLLQDDYGHREHNS